MGNMINFGIDLGTTNSLIAKFSKGETNIFKNPIGWKESIPSVVSFRKNKIVIGEQAKVYLEKSPQSVISSFKRKMGTKEAYKVKNLNESITPIDLSAHVLKELKTFIQSGEEVDSAVITIPASFDTIQSNATKEAGKIAGFKQVILLQEPIAASLAYANKSNIGDLDNGLWIVYDLGGGTFDVALVKIHDGEMKIIDHEGDNFLGGSDFDRIIVENKIIPYLEKEYGFKNLEHEMKSATGRYNSTYYIALHQAEQSKIQLSAKTSAEIEFDITDDHGQIKEINITITRSEFESMITDHINSTIDMIKTMLAKNSLTSKDVEFILMVGGSTYIPYIRKRVSEILQIPTNCKIDPTNAIVIGAAFYAGTKQKKIATKKSSTSNTSNIFIKTAYQKATNESEEFFAARIDGDIEGLYYRIIREDGGYDSGLKELKKKITEDLPLISNNYNYFNLSIYDKQNNPIPIDIEPIGIAQGKYIVHGQPLPNDICLEVDDFINNETRLELIFKKNSILPLKRSITKEINKYIGKGSNEYIRINVLEGPINSLPEANKSIGFLEINGNHISRDISKGSDVELTIDISESRDLTISAYLNMTNQEFKEVFTPIKRNVPIDILSEQITDLSQKLEDEIQLAIDLENYESANELTKLKDETNSLQSESNNLASDDTTDKRYQLEDKKCKIAQSIYDVTKDKELEIAKSNYFENKTKCDEIINNNGNDSERKHYNDIIAQESDFLSSNSILKIREKTEKLDEIAGAIRWRTPEFLIDIFNWLINQRQKFNDQEQSKSLIEAGKFAISIENFDRLFEVIQGLFNLLPENSKKEMKSKIGFY